MILRNEMITQGDFEVIKDVCRQSGLIDHISVEGIGCKIRHCESNLFDVVSIGESQIIGHSKKPNIDDPGIPYFAIEFAGLHWFCH
jgi:hypothetical protein